MSDRRVASGGDYSTKMVSSMFREGQARGLRFSGSSIANPAMDFVESSRPGYAATFEEPGAFELLHTTIHWGDFRHPMHDAEIEVMYDLASLHTDWDKARRAILGSAVGQLLYDTSPEPVVAESAASSDLSEERLRIICAEAGVPLSIYLLGRTSAMVDGPNIAFLWHPSIIEPGIALTGLQAAVSPRSQ